MAYLARIRGDRADNLERAIAAFEAALTVRTSDNLPREWAATQNNLGNAYVVRITGERADNMEKAIAAFEAALTVRTREALPRLWAETQNNLAIVYLDRIRGERADNLEKAIAAYESVLTIFTRESLPRLWATAQNNIGHAYLGRVHGERANNVEKAIAAYQAALTVTTREALPREWAQTQHNLAYAYRNRAEPAGNMEKVIAHYEAALEVFTRESLPREQLRTGRALGETLLLTGDWHKAGLAYATARGAFLLLFGQGLNDVEARELIDAAGPLFAEAAFAAAQRGEGESALSLANEGRAQLMAVALRLQSLKLAAPQLRRLDELRAAIRAAERSVEDTRSAERATALEKLAVLRQELLGLVKSAAAESKRGSALAQVRALVANGGAVVVPIITRLGGKIVIVTGGSTGTSERPERSAQKPPAPLVTVLDLPELTTGGLDAVLTRWFAAYPASNLSYQEINKRLAQWERALDALIPELWPLFAGKLDAALKERGLKPGARLVWLPTGALGTLPLGAAQDPVSKRRLSDNYEIVYAPSLGALTAAQTRVSQDTIPTLAAIINPTGDLPGTEKEGVIVASYFKKRARTLLKREKASPEAVLAALKGKSHWHFASHGTFSWDDARQSALIMHGHKHLGVGKLLESEGLGRPRLVVLSACETAICDICGHPDEFIGLPGTFTALGAAGVLGTLWPVSDAATALLMAKFYELHMGKGLSPSTALSQAQAWLRQATNADLALYARVAARQGRLESRHAAEIERELSEEGLTRSRNSALVEWIALDAARTADKAPSESSRRLARPYVHPYYWAGFIHTGL
jgi:CHAT domain-containing protein/tetratricopeptide (TPR) repeat protein